MHNLDEKLITVGAGFEINLNRLNKVNGRGIGSPSANKSLEPGCSYEDSKDLRFGRPDAFVLRAESADMLVS